MIVTSLITSLVTSLITSLINHFDTNGINTQPTEKNMVENIRMKYISKEIYSHEKLLNEIHSSYVNKNGNF